MVAAEVSNCSPSDCLGQGIDDEIDWYEKKHLKMKMAVAYRVWYIAW